jgi:hypothetical protein
MPVAKERANSLVARSKAAEMAFSSPIASRLVFTAFQFALISVSWRGESFGCDSINCSCCDSCPVACGRQGAWFVALTDNFQVCSLESAAQAEKMAKHCEQVRAAIMRTWCDDCSTWTPKCQIVLHRTARDYVRAVGAGSDATLGSSLVQPTTGAIRTRRIDLRTDVDDYLTAALPHEMCHVVLADRFRDKAPPLWFDEGVALQYDTVEKQRLHERDRQIGLTRQTSYPLFELLALEGYPPAERWNVFYGQSAALVRWLLTQGSPLQLVKCVEQSQQVGISIALRESFGPQISRDILLSAGQIPLAPTLRSSIQLVSVTTPPTGHPSRGGEL